MLSNGKNFLLFDEVETLEEIYKKIEEVTSEEILEIANEMLSPSELSTLILKTTMVLNTPEDAFGTFTRYPAQDDKSYDPS